VTEESFVWPWGGGGEDHSVPDDESPTLQEVAQHIDLDSLSPSDYLPTDNLDLDCDQDPYAIFPPSSNPNNVSYLPGDDEDDDILWTEEESLDQSAGDDDDDDEEWGQAPDQPPDNFSASVDLKDPKIIWEFNNIARQVDDPKIIAKLISLNNVYITYALATNPACPPDVLLELLDHPSPVVMWAVLRNLSVPISDLLERAHGGWNRLAWELVISRPDCDESVLGQALAETNNHPDIALYILDNAQCDEGLRERCVDLLRAQPDEYLRSLASNSTTSVPILSILKEFPGLDTVVAENPQMDNPVLQAIEILGH